ncbi:MAG: CUAEP/CCAEP-tail radical SAM protein [Candidatus Acidiferrum sp.]
MNIVLLSTYELGRQPFGLASPAAWLRNRNHQVTCFDLARQALEEQAVDAAQLIAIYLPMHTATRLAVQLIPALRERNLQARLCCYGLYAPMNAEYLRTLGVDSIVGGEFESELARLAEGLEPTTELSLERLEFEVPDRSGLPGLEKYAHLIMPGDGYRIVGSTEASRGCKHLCRHCPIVPVYKGAFRIVSREVVLEDIRRQVAEGSQHITFGDPDFFNGIGHALKIIEEFHREFPTVTYDVTIKIEHLRKYEKHLEKLKDTGCLFVISAVESVDDAVLNALDKGHTREDFLHVVRTFRSLGMTLHPTFVPFTPWTTLASYVELLKVLDAEGLVENVAPIQLGIRLLIPAGSRMLELADVRRIASDFDAASLAHPWKHADARVDALSETVQSVAADADRKKQERTEAFERIWQAAHHAIGSAAPRREASAKSLAVPFLSEPWYCCAEPTSDQLLSIGGCGSRVPAVVERTAAPTMDSFV